MQSAQFLKGKFAEIFVFFLVLHVLSAPAVRNAGADDEPAGARNKRS